MKINKITLYNFSSFEGINEFDFTNDDSNKNIILIGGKNGAGKTSLFTAIKIALYGPLAYGYVGINPRYISKIKDCINTKAFQKDVVESYVQLEVTLMVERDLKIYEIKRAWDYSKQKLEETYSVKNENRLLNKQELSYFQNYLHGLVPPGLFDFFLFDGEEVGNIFVTSSYNGYVKNAIYTLCGLDIFELIRKYTGSYIGKASNQEEETLYHEYEKVCSDADDFSSRIASLTDELGEKNTQMEQLETAITELGTAFKNAGGITEKEQKQLAKEYAEAERIKTENTAKMKMFMEERMPFYILKDFTRKISEQLELEEKEEIYHYIQNKVNKEDIKGILKDNVSDDVVNAVFEMFIEKFKPKGFIENSQPVYDLSKEETIHVRAIMSMVDNFDIEGMICCIQEKKKAADRTAEINRQRKNAMAEEEAVHFAEKENRLLKEKAELIQVIRELQEELSSDKEKQSVLILQRERLLQHLKDKVQNKHVIDLSIGLSNMMKSLLAQKTEAIKRSLEQNIVENLNQIYRKNNLITYIEIEDNFQFNLYQNAIYKAEDIINLLNNIGKDAFSETIGKRGEKELFEEYGVTDWKTLQQIIRFADAEREFKLYKKIDLNRLSKGERQIFILSLYWAIIELSGQDIPFIIDTPYARIDANHRREISEKFFPNISKQVIILSTDEEINEEYYQIIKPYIAKEYLLINDENQNKTSVEHHYFFGE